MSIFNKGVNWEVMCVFDLEKSCKFVWMFVVLMGFCFVVVVIVLVMLILLCCIVLYVVK